MTPDLADGARVPPDEGDLCSGTVLPSSGALWITASDYVAEPPPWIDDPDFFSRDLNVRPGLIQFRVESDIDERVNLRIEFHGPSDEPVPGSLEVDFTAAGCLVNGESQSEGLGEFSDWSLRPGKYSVSLARNLTDAEQSGSGANEQITLGIWTT